MERGTSEVHFHRIKTQGEIFCVNITNPNIQIVGAKVLSDQNSSNHLLLKCRSVKCLVVGRRIVGRNLARVVVYCLCYVTKHTITRFMR